MAVTGNRSLAMAERRGQSPWLRSWHRFLRRRVAVGALVVIILFYGAGIFAPWVAPYSYTEKDLDQALLGPSLAHPLGTDRIGRDLLSRVIWGIRTSVIVSIAAVSTGSIVLGIVLGAAAGYLGKKVDTLVMRIGEVFLAFPGLLLVILIAATTKPRVVEWVSQVERATGFQGLVKSGMVDYFVVFGALALFGWVGMARLVRGQILYLREAQFVEAAVVLGASPGRIIFRHLLPNAMAPVIVSVSMAMGSAVGSEVMLSWLGVGIQPPSASLGAMILENGSISVLRTNPNLLLSPVVVVGILIFAFNLLGDGLNDALNPRSR